MTHTEKRSVVLWLVGLLAVATAVVGCTSPLEQASCTPGEDPGPGYVCEDGFRVAVDTDASVDTGGMDAEDGPDVDTDGGELPDACQSPTDEEFCRESGLPCAEITREDRCGDERKVDCTQYIDFNTSQQHCGSCDNSCELEHGAAVCETGACRITSCEVDHRDLDGDPSNGCECEVSEEICDGKDNDCDGETDEGVKFRDLGKACDGDDADECTNGTWECNPAGDGLVCGQESKNAIKEICDGKDNDCDGETDEGFPNLGEACDGSDADQCKQGIFECTQDFAGTVCVGDGGMPSKEVCDGKDNDCDGDVDEGLTVTFWKDTDGDGKGDPNSPVQECPGSHTGLVDNKSDNCDSDPNNWTKSGCQDCKDADNDGFYAGCDQYDPNSLPGPDCNDKSKAQRPGNNELCDNLDNDCDTKVDEMVTRTCGTNQGQCTKGTEVCSKGQWGSCSGTPPSPETCDNRDNDCDGRTDEQLSRTCGINIGVCSVGQETCSAGRWQSCTAITPSPEVCDGVDNDCDGRTDEICDQDGDGHCNPKANYSAGYNKCQTKNDCDDQDGSVYPGATELCDGKLNDCNDQNVPADEKDSDGDGYVVCSPWKGSTNGIKGGGDCDDADKLAYPGATEICDGVRQDCNGGRGFDAWCKNKYPQSNKCIATTVRGTRTLCCRRSGNNCVPRETNCSNGGFDDDQDGKADCADPDCHGIWCAANSQCNKMTGKCEKQ